MSYSEFAAEGSVARYPDASGRNVTEPLARGLFAADRPFTVSVRRLTDGLRRRPCQPGRRWLGREPGRVRGDPLTPLSAPSTRFLPTGRTCNGR